MTFLWTLREVKRAVGVRTHGADCDITGISIDSRTTQKGDLFVALKREKDGHDYVQQAFEQGAVAALVSKHIPSAIEQVEVDDTLKALEKMGEAQRDWSSAMRIAVTGSCGKTSTKELLAKGLGAHKSDKSFNNHFGVPLTLSLLPRDAKYGVFEIGMNHPGEIEPLVRMVRPDIAIITNIALVHAGAFAGLSEIAQEKLSIQSGLKEDGVLVTPYETYMAHKELFKTKPLTFSLEETDPADVVLEGRSQSISGQTLAVNVKGERVVVNVPLVGEHHAMNVLCVLAVAHLLREDLKVVALRLETAHAVEGRGLVHNVDGVRIIDESYNASPKTMSQALNNFKQMPNVQRRIAILGDMLELGDMSSDFHVKLAPDCDGIETVVCVGEHMEKLFNMLPKGCEKYHFEKPKDINLHKLCSQLEIGDGILVKGSKGIFWNYNFVPKLLKEVKLKSQKVILK